MITKNSQKGSIQVVGAIIRNHKNEFLIQLRDDEVSRFKNCWSLFGGRVEENEELEEALLRELHEELSLIPGDIESMREVQLNKDTDGAVIHIYEIHIDKTIAQLTLGEGAAMEYVSKEQLFDRKFAFDTEEVLRKYIHDSGYLNE